MAMAPVLRPILVLPCKTGEEVTLAFRLLDCRISLQEWFALSGCWLTSFVRLVRELDGRRGVKMSRLEQQSNLDPQ